MFLNDSLSVAHFLPHTESIFLLFLTVTLREVNVSCAFEASTLSGGNFKMVTGREMCPPGCAQRTTLTPPQQFGFGFFLVYFCLPLSPTVTQRRQLLVAFLALWQASVRYQLWRFPSQGRWENKLAFGSGLCHNHGGASPKRNTSTHI